MTAPPRTLPSEPSLPGAGGGTDGADPLSARAPALVPALLAALFAAWAGTFETGASAPAAAVAHGALLALAAGGLVVLARPPEREGGRGIPAGLLDPLGLGGAGRLLPWALLAVVAAAWWASPVPRAGIVGLALLPAFAVAPAALARCWMAGPTTAARGIAAVVAGVSLWALGSWWLREEDLPAQPLGQHLPLVAWIVILLPLAAVPLAERGAHRRLGRVLGWLAVAAGCGAVVATGALAGLLALAVEGALVLVLLAPGEAAGRGRAVRGGLLGLIGLVALAGMGALALAIRGGDPSLLARAVYWRGGWEGVLERPLLGFGPGASAWTLAGHLRPVPGVSPPGEVVGEVHLLPLAVAYEIGLPGLALALASAVLFVLRRRRGRTAGGAPVDPVGAVGSAGLVGLAGAAAMGCATADWRILALPVAVAIAAGAALAGDRTETAGGRPPAGRSGGAARRWGAGLASAYVLAAAWVLVPLDRAHGAYDRALAEVAAGAEAADRVQDALETAVRLDPDHPLYRFQAARQRWLALDETERRSRRKALEVGRETMASSLRAAEDARGVAALWLRAGAAAAALGEGGVAAPAFERACGLSPLGATAPFGLLAVGSTLHRPDALGARALAAEPRLGAALLWQERPGLLDRALGILETTEGIDAGWRQETVRRIRRLHADGPPGGPVVTVGLVADRTSHGSLSLHAFRRRPWQMDLVPIPVRRPGAEALAELPPATILPGTDPRLFPPTCVGPFAPQTLRKTLWKTW